MVHSGTGVRVVGRTELTTRRRGITLTSTVEIRTKAAATSRTAVAAIPTTAEVHTTIPMTIRIAIGVVEGTARHLRVS